MAGLRPAYSPSTFLRLNGEDLRPLPLEERRARLRRALRGAGEALRFSEHLEGDGEAIFRHACALGLEGIVSKRRDARYRSGRKPSRLVTLQERSRVCAGRADGAC